MDWNSIQNLIGSRPLYFYGRSEDWVHKALIKVGKPLSIIDRDSYYWDKKYYDIPVKPIEQTVFESNPFILVTAADYGGIVEILEDRGYIFGKDFALSPDFAGYSRLCEVRSFQAKVLLASSDYNDQRRARSSQLGGGLYLLSLPTGQLQRLHTGSLRQLVRSPRGYLTLDYVSKEILEFSSDFSLIRRGAIPLANACGIAYSNHLDEIIIANPGQDLIEFYSYDNLDLLHTSYLCNYQGKRFPGGHHVNDIFLHEDELFISYFSACGRWKQNLLDGGVSVLDLNVLRTSEVTPIQPPLISGLCKPHTPFMLNNTLHVVDSLGGRLTTFANPSVTQFPAFIRGCDSSESYFAIGVSEDMYIAESPQTDTTLLNSGVVLSRPDLNIARFYPTYGLMNIHSLLFV